MSLKIGDKAPNFTLVSSDKKNVSLSDYSGQNLVLMFFPMAFTGVCTEQLCTTRDVLYDYNKLNTSVLGISVDSPFSLDKFKSEQNLNFPLLSDFNKEAITAYDCAYETFAFGLKGVAKRSAFIIDKQGIIQYAEVLESAGDLPNFNAIKTTLNSLS